MLFISILNGYAFSINGNRSRCKIFSRKEQWAIVEIPVGNFWLGNRFEFDKRSSEGRVSSWWRMIAIVNQHPLFDWWTPATGLTIAGGCRWISGREDETTFSAWRGEKKGSRIPHEEKIPRPARWLAISQPPWRAWLRRTLLRQTSGS